MDAETLVYPAYYDLSPSDLIVFGHCPGFFSDWHDVGLGDYDLHVLRVSIMCDPKMAPVIEFTDGLREVEFYPAEWSEDRFVTVRHVYFEEFSNVLLVAAYEGCETMPFSERRMVASMICDQHRLLTRKRNS